MENIFSLTEAKILSTEAYLPQGNGLFLLYQLSESTEIFHSLSRADGEGNTETVRLCADEVYVGDIHGAYRILPTSDGKAIYISVCGELTDALSRLYGISDGFTAKAPESREIFEELRSTIDSSGFNEKEKPLKSSLTLHRLMQVLSHSQGTRLVRRTALRIKDFIDSHLEEKTDLDTLSGVFFMSRTQLHRLFKEEYGISPIKYLINRRIELSKKLLENESLKLSEIAEALCFSDAKHFSKTFFKHEGILPSEYRKNIK